MRAWTFACGPMGSSLSWRPTPIRIFPPRKISPPRRSRPAFSTTICCIESCSWARIILLPGAAWRLELLSRPAVQPLEYRVVPLNAVGWFQDPMVLVGKVQQLARNAAALQGREHGDALRVRHPVVLLALNHQRRRLPLGDMVDGIELGIRRWVLVFGTGKLVFRKPQLFGRVVHRAIVEDTVVANQALETVRPLPCNPIDHVAAIRCAQRAHVVWIEPRIGLECRVQTKLEILQGLAAPIAADGIGKRLTVAGRAVKI